MAAHRRRTTFAAPLIVTVASCSSSGKADQAERPPRYPGTVWSVFMQPDGCHALEEPDCPPNVACNPPPVREVKCPPGSSGRNIVRIAQRADSQCAVLPEGCTSDRCLESPAECPLPPGKTIPKKLGSTLEIEMRAGECHVEEHTPECPPNADCNPPAPRRVRCPPGITEEANVNIVVLVDGSCAIVPEGCTTQDCVGARAECPR